MTTPNIKELVERTKKLLNDWIQTDGEDAPPEDLQLLEDNMFALESLQARVDELKNKKKKFRNMSTKYYGRLENANAENKRLNDVLKRLGDEAPMPATVERMKEFGRSEMNHLDKMFDHRIRLEYARANTEGEG